MKSFVIALALWAPGVARAQYSNPYTGASFNNPGSAMISSMLSERMHSRILGTDQPLKKKAAAPAHQPIEKTDFPGARKRLTTQAIIAQLASAPAQRQALGEAIDKIYVELEKGARKNNLASAVAFLLGASLMVDRGTTFDDAQSEALVATINDELVAAPAFARTSTADKQKMYETLVTFGGLVLLFQELGKTDPEAARSAKQLAQQSLAMLGVK